MTHGKVWPAHPKPLPDELLSSWFVRVAEANEIKLQTLSWLLFGYNRSPWNRDIDHIAPPWFAEAVCMHTGIGYDEVYRTTLDGYFTRLYPKRRSSGQLRWVLPIISYGAMHQGYGMQFCPACLAQDAAPYFRKQWRLALFTYCPIHGCALHDACPICGVPVAYFRHDFGKEISLTKGIACCWNCEFDFREAERKAAKFPTDELREIFEDMLRSLGAPATEAGRFDLGFFAVLHQFCRIMGMRQNRGKLLRYVAEQLEMPVALPTLGRISIEQRRRDVRHQWLLCALWLMIDPERRLKAAWLDKAVRYNLMVKDFDGAPGWYRELVGRFSDWRAK